MQRVVAPVIVALATASLANAWFKVACSLPIVQERVDPILSPGGVAQHMHTVHGGSNFGVNSTFDTLRASSCTSCEVPQDLSSYWVATLYFHDPVTGAFEKVPNGGLLVYYQNRGKGNSDGGPKYTAFPPGFRMISGKAAKRVQAFPPGEGSQDELTERAITGSCLRYNTTQSEGYDYIGFPTTDCEIGMKARLRMQSCWDGKNLWLPDSAHVSYLSDLDDGVCDSDHPVYLMTLFYEVLWDLSSFRSRWVPQGYKWPFVWSCSDPTGFGWHGDFFNGWDVSALQNAIDHCDDPTNMQQMIGDTTACPYLTVNSGETASSCKIANVDVKESGSLTGPLDALPGCNPLQYGPCDATLSMPTDCPTTPSTCNATAPAPTTSAPSASGSPIGSTYLGCYTDNADARTLTLHNFTNSAMTNALCAQTCAGQGFMYAGTENGQECYCGNSFANGGSLTDPAECTSACMGAKFFICGGAKRLSVYKV